MTVPSWYIQQLLAENEDPVAGQSGSCQSYQNDIRCEEIQREEEELDESYGEWMSSWGDAK